ncbi:hypothetical protein FE257_010313 [Aspergillus nanangensis]|uniref:Peptidase S1 domain-containing protein n=1 Tax=Aspergillus nanangensis TaxID=2582783 RepID=A0AAD4CJF1_ASPNN|nr:hypothetical protein FE257_010313 [Aspergillus nanangensis]
MILHWLGLAILLALFSPASAIIGGSDAYPGEFPQVVSITNFDDHICGGSILSATEILTAAHCVDDINPNSLGVLVSSINRYTDWGRIRVQEYRIPEEYDRKTYANDIAVIYLSRPIELSVVAEPVRFPSDPNLRENVEAVVVGWGLTTAQGLDQAAILQKLDATTTSRDLCEHRWDLTVYPNSSVFCTSYPWGKGTCYGDAGGPIFNSAREQIGILGLAADCDLDNPGLNFNVSHYLDWIQRNQVKDQEK